MNEPKRLDIYLQEYSKLKDEQTQRIGFRDNLLYVTLSLFGAILALTAGEKATPYALLVLPWVCLVLGWTYVVNDQKISAIGDYIQHHLAPQLAELTDSTFTQSKQSDSIFGWEAKNKLDHARKRRKVEQLVINEVAFICPGIVALVVFTMLVPQAMWQVRWLEAIEAGLLMILGLEIWLHADLTTGC